MWDEESLPDIREVYDFELFRECLNESLKSLTKREEEVIRLSFGIDSGREHTVDEIASIMDVGRARVFKLKAESMTKMRHPIRARDIAAIAIDVGILPSRKVKDLLLKAQELTQKR